MPMLGPLAFLARFSEGIFARLDGVQLTERRVPPDPTKMRAMTAPRILIRAGQELLSSRLNRSNLLGSWTNAHAGTRGAPNHRAGRGGPRATTTSMGRRWCSRTGRTGADRWASASPPSCSLDHTNSQIERAINRERRRLNRQPDLGNRRQLRHPRACKNIDFTISLPAMFDIPYPAGGRLLLNVDTFREHGVCCSPGTDLASAVLTTHIPLSPTCTRLSSAAP